MYLQLLVKGLNYMMDKTKYIKYIYTTTLLLEVVKKYPEKQEVHVVLLVQALH